MLIVKKSSKIRNKFDLKDVARILDVSYITVAKMCREGELKYTKIAQKYYVSKRDLNIYMNTGDIFDKPKAIIINVIKQAIKEASEENIKRLEIAVKQKIIADLESNIKKKLVEISKNNEQFKKLLPVKVVKQLKDRENRIKKELEKVK